MIHYWYGRRAEPPAGSLGALVAGDAPSERDVLVNDRFGPRRTVTLEGWQPAVYRGCDRTAQDTASGDVAADDLLGPVAWLDAGRFMLGRGDHHLALAVHSPPRGEATADSPRLHRTIAVPAS